MNEREFIARVEAANTQELIQILSRPSLEEDRVLRLHLGTERYERLRQLALQTGGKRGVKKGNVAVLHGIMGGELTVYNNKTEQRIWLHFPRLIIGGAGWLRMRDGGFGTVVTSLAFKYFGGDSGSNSGMASPTGFEPVFWP